LDDTYQVYVNRVVRATLPDTYQTQAQYIQVSPKFGQTADGAIVPTPFAGYTVITPPWAEDSKNGAVYEHLQQYQQQILNRLEPNLLIPLPAESFHFTLADLIWADAFHHAREEDPDFEQKLHDRVAESFEKSEPLVQYGQAIRWQIIGLFLRTRALGVCLVPRDETSYDRVAALRRTLYQNSNLIALGVEQQYNFTAHITLGYFGEAANATDRDRLSQTLIELNNHWLDSEQTHDVWVHRAELRKFDNMTHYYREPNWAVLEF
jgi:2'-5' RNA ligase